MKTQQTYTVDAAFTEAQQQLQEFMAAPDLPSLVDTVNSHPVAMEWRDINTQLDNSEAANNTLAHLIAHDPVMRLMVMTDRGNVLLVVKSLMLASFIAGRLYGRSELMRELEGK